MNTTAINKVKIGLRKVFLAIGQVLTDIRNGVAAICKKDAELRNDHIDLRTRVIDIYEKNSESRRGLTDISNALSEMRKADMAIQKAFTTGINPAIIFKNIIYN